MNPTATALTTAITALHKLTMNDVDVLVAACDGDAAFRSRLLDQRAAAIFTNANSQASAAAGTVHPKAQFLADLTARAIVKTVDPLAARMKVLEDRVLELEATKAATTQPVEP